MEWDDGGEVDRRTFHLSKHEAREPVQFSSTLVPMDQNDASFPSTSPSRWRSDGLLSSTNTQYALMHWGPLSSAHQLATWPRRRSYIAIGLSPSALEKCWSLTCTESMADSP